MNKPSRIRCQRRTERGWPGVQEARHQFTVKVVGTGDGRTFEDLLLSISELILESVAKASIERNNVKKDDIIDIKFKPKGRVYK